MGKQRMVVWVAGATIVATAVVAGCSSTSTTSPGSPAATAAPGSSAPTPDTSAPTTGSTPKGTSPTGSAPKGGSERTSDFCASIKAADDRSKATTGAAQSKPTRREIEAFVDDLRAARAAGPAEMDEPLTTIIEAYAAFAKIVDDPNPDQQAMDLFLSEKSLTAEKKLEEFVKESCGFTINTGSSGSTTDDTGPAGSVPADDRPTSVSNVKAAIKAKAGNLSWAPAITGGSWGYSGDGTTYDWTVQADSTGRALSADAAFDACTLIAEHLTPLQPSFSLQIQSSDGTLLAEKTAGGSCKKV